MSSTTAEATTEKRKANVSTLKAVQNVHPAADIFPMMPEDELEELAALITRDGQIDDIVVDERGRIVDGRNRKAACAIAGVEPRYTTLTGMSPYAYIINKNVARRHMNAGQRALAAVVVQEMREQHALADGDPDSIESTEIWRTAKTAADHLGVGPSVLGKAQTIHRYAPHLSDAVIANRSTFDSAYEFALRKRREQMSDEERVALEKEKEAEWLHKLSTAANDLYVRVTEENLNLTEAWAAYQQRLEDERVARELHTAAFAQGMQKVWTALGPDPDHFMRMWVPGANEWRNYEHLQRLWTADGLKEVAKRLTKLAKKLDELGTGLS